MGGMLSLNGQWQLTYAEGSPLAPPEHLITGEPRDRHWLNVTVPAPIHRVLMAAGLLDDPNLGLNSLKARWVEEMFWIYRHTFDAPDEAASQHASLLFQHLELNATVWLNGEQVGRHANAHRPARFDVTGKIKAGENLLVVLVESGIHAAAEKPVAEYAATQIDHLVKRQWQRKAQYQCGWDWNPRLMNVGILGDVRLEWQSVARLDQVTVTAVPSDDLTAATVRVRASVVGACAEPVDAKLMARIAETGQEATVALTIAEGEARPEITIELPQPRLWWPVGQGEPALYTVEVTLAVGDEAQTIRRRTGVRHVEVDQSPLGNGRRFALKVNGRRIFCKGANWVPPDLFHSPVAPERYRRLVELARQANFNLLRVWGGGIYADHALCDACDEAGILMWHDFLFACAKYPGDDPEFAAEVRREVTWAVRELAHHPCLVVWCGNNEIEWGDWDWGYDDRGRTHPHYAMFHHDIPRILALEDPSKFYWPSSPYSPDYRPPNDPEIGDQHPWGVSILDPGPADWWKYRDYEDRFANEGGVIGASSPATLREFLPENERFLRSPSWDHHDNPLAMTGSRPGEQGRAYATVEFWTGRDPATMDWGEYAFVSALLQAEGLQEYIANYRRRMFDSGAAVFWMYNDSWPVTHGWTILDYYLRRKLAYHPVRRAFRPVTVTVAEQDDGITIWGVNDTPEPWTGRMRSGLFALAGGLPHNEEVEVTLPANASSPLAQLSRSHWDTLGVTRTGAFAVLLERGEVVAQHRLLRARFKDLEFVAPHITMKLEGGRLALASDAFAWGVCLDLDGDLPLPDNCFDLLPGIAYAMPWAAELGEPRIVRVGSRDAVSPKDHSG